MKRKIAEYISAIFFHYKIFASFVVKDLSFLVQIARKCMVVFDRNIGESENEMKNFSVKFQFIERIFSKCYTVRSFKNQ